MGLEREGVAVYLAPLFAVGLIQRVISSKNNFKWFIADEWVKYFITKVSGFVPQIKLKEDEPEPEEEVEEEDKAEDEFNNWGK